MGKKYCICSEAVSVVRSDPRCIIVRACQPKAGFYIVSAHAPYAKCKINSANASSDPSSIWWRELGCIVQNVCMPSVPLIMGIDGNYILFNDPCCGIGEVVNVGNIPVQHADVCDF